MDDSSLWKKSNLHSSAWRSQTNRHRRHLKGLQKALYCVGILLGVVYVFKGSHVSVLSKRTTDQYPIDVCQKAASQNANLPEFVDISFEDATNDDVLMGWEEDWVAHGELPYVEPGTSLGRTKFDTVVSWVNGSDSNFRDVRRAYATDSILNRPESTWLHDSLSRHREWSQVQWAALSCARNMESLNRIQILTSHNQIPEFPNLTDDERYSVQNSIDYISDSSLYDVASKKCNLPTFNSVSIEVNMGNIPSTVDKFLYLCDDMLLTTKYQDGDLYTPLYGLSMIIYDGLVWNVDQDEPHNLNQPNQGEYPEYAHSSYIFNSAFGKRNRAYVRHATKVYSRKLLREVKAAFPAAYADASISRFRGDRRVINPHFHAHHYVIERHRKALLWSFLKLKSDQDGDGLLSIAERLAIKKTLMLAADVPSGNTRTTMKMMKKNLHATGFTTANALKPKWSSFDGPAYAFYQESTIERNPVFHEYKTSVLDKPHLEYRCELDYEECFGHGFFEDPRKRFAVNDLLRRFSVERPTCGDCLLNKLVLASGAKGLNALLPGPEDQSLRDLAVKTIMRYSYTKNKLLGNMIILGPSDYDLELLDYKLRILTEGHEPMPAQMCVNDDVPMETSSGRVEEIRSKLHQFYRSILDGPSLDPLRTYQEPIMPKRSDYPA